MKKCDEERRAEADEFPADVEDRDVPGERHQQHAGDEHRQKDEIAVVAGLAVQVPVRECRHDTGDSRRQHRERERDAIDQELDGDAALMRGGPRAV